MSRCFNYFKSLTSAAENRESSSSHLHAPSTSRSSTQPSPTVNLLSEYALAMQTNSYREIRSKIHPSDLSPQDIYNGELGNHKEEELLAQVLQPNRECVQEALHCTKSGALKDLVSAYFDHSENTFLLCLRLHHNIHRVHHLYSSLFELFDVLPRDPNSLTESQCDQAFDIFVEFDQCENPFPCPKSLNFDGMRLCFSQLKQQLDFRLSKSNSMVRLVQRVTMSSGLCLIGATVGVFISAIVIASHALVAVLAGPFIPILLPSKITKRELAHLAQLEAAAKGTYVLHNDLDTIDCLVARLFSTVESDKFFIHLGLGRGRDKHSIQVVVRQLQKNYQSFRHQLDDLEEHLCLCFAAINRARSLLHEEISLHLCS